MKDFSRTAGSRDKSSSPIRIEQEAQRERDDRRLSSSSPASRALEPSTMLQREHPGGCQQDEDERIGDPTLRSSVSPASRREMMDDRSDSEANRSLEGDRADHLDLEEQSEIRSVAHSEDLNVMDSDCELEREVDNGQEKEEKSSPVVPQPIHPGVQRPSQGPPYLPGAPGAPAWNPAGFPHSLAGFAWLPPPPHPHNPHGHLYTPHGGPTSPNGKCAPSLRRQRGKDRLQISFLFPPRRENALKFEQKRGKEHRFARGGARNPLLLFFWAIKEH